LDSFLLSKLLSINRSWWTVTTTISPSLTYINQWGKLWKWINLAQIYTFRCPVKSPANCQLQIWSSPGWCQLKHQVVMKMNTVYRVKALQRTYLCLRTATRHETNSFCMHWLRRLCSFATISHNKAHHPVEWTSSGHWTQLENKEAKQFSITAVGQWSWDEVADIHDGCKATKALNWVWYTWSDSLCCALNSSGIAIFGYNPKQRDHTCCTVIVEYQKRE
jgi:hypothetical protein